MQRPFSFKSLRARTVQNKFSIIISLIILILLFGLVNIWFSIKVMSGIRAYVGGEGLWSKAQKEAVNNLLKYSDSHQEADYDNYLHFTQVQLGDKQARLELDKPHPDLRIVVQEGFVKGGNDPRDVNNLVFLYRRFRHVSYMSSAIQTWAQGDEEIQNLLNIGDQMHKVILTPVPANNLQAQAAKVSQISALQGQIYATDTRLTVLENDFSAILGNASRNIGKLLLEVALISTVLLGALTLSIAILIARAIVHLDKQKSEFVSLASHQLRTPLTTINWNAESLLAGLAGKLSEKQKEYLEDLYDSGQRMVTLISNLLKASSLEFGTYKPAIKPVNISKALDTIIKDQQLEIDQKAISLTKNFNPDIKEVSLDEQLLTMVLQNLLSNSIKYTQNGGQININAWRKKRYLIVEVSDNGVGIPKKQQSKIFDKLFRADNAKKLDVSGTGLGLYIVKASVQQMGGTIYFDSVENKGTSFYVKLPL